MKAKYLGLAILLGGLGGGGGDPPQTSETPGPLVGLINNSEATRLGMVLYAVFCLEKKKSEER